MWGHSDGLSLSHVRDPCSFVQNLKHVSSSLSLLVARRSLARFVPTPRDLGLSLSFDLDPQ